jgi:hypothetical protein
VTRAAAAGHRGAGRPRPAACWLAALLLLGPASLPAAAAKTAAGRSGDGGAFFLEGTSLGLSFAALDLDGARVLGNADQVFFVPRLKPSLGFGIGFGRRFRSGLWSLSYLVSGHDAALRGRDSSAVSRLVQVNARTFLARSRGLRPFLHLGLNFPWIKVRDGVADRLGRLHDAHYAGLGVNIGAGALAPVSSRMFFSASLLYRYNGYLYAYGPVKAIDVTDLFDDVTGPRHTRFLRAPVVALELSLGYEL